MFIRRSFFRARPKPGHEGLSAARVRDRLVPLWTRFPGAGKVRALRRVESDAEEPRLDRVLAVGCRSRAAIALAPASDVRHHSRAVTAGLMDRFDGDIFHTLFEGDDLALPTGEVAA